MRSSFISVAVPTAGVGPLPAVPEVAKALPPSKLGKNGWAIEANSINLLTLNPDDEKL